MQLIEFATAVGQRPGRRRVLKSALVGAFIACGAGRALSAIASTSPADMRRLRAALFVNGTLGDRSFYDSAARGLKTAQRALGIQTRVVEAGMDPTRWEPALLDAADGDDFDVILAGSFIMVPLIQKVALRYPRKRFILFDAAVDYSLQSDSSRPHWPKSDPGGSDARGSDSRQTDSNDANSPGSRSRPYGNVHSILFRQNEGAYLAGWMAGKLASPKGSAGVIGGMQIPVIDDFIVGFIAGASAARPGMPVARQYVNSFTDPAQAKEIAKAMFGRGAEIVFHAAGGSGQGVIEAAAEAGRLVIGVDSDQYALVRSANPARARAIVTSVLKNVDVAVREALKQQLSGTLAYGTARSLGLAEGGISLAEGSDVWRATRPDIIREMHEVQQRIAQGTLKVPSGFGPQARP